MQRIICQSDEALHALMNNGGCVLNLFKLNLGYRLVLDVELLPLPGCGCACRSWESWLSA